ncbi:hypothetical protein H1R20_g11960, partial [Candolleomyces eurysporus]
MPRPLASMPPGTLRYGLVVRDGVNETVEWRHWGCVTPAILNLLAGVTVDRIIGFKDLDSSDQQKVRLAVSLRRVDPSDVPTTAKVRSASGVATTSTAVKRKADSSTSLVPPPLTQGTRRAMIAEEEEAAAAPLEEEARDEMYAFMNTDVVGIRHYRGLVGPGEEVLLVREPQNPYDRNAIQVKNISRQQVGHLSRGVASQLSPLLDKKLITVEGVINDGNLTGSSGYTLSITLKFYGSPDKRGLVMPKLPYQARSNATQNRPQAPVASTSARSVIGGRVAAMPTASRQAAAAVRANAGPSKPRVQGPTPAQLEAIKKQQEALQRAQELQQTLNTLERVNDEGRRSSLLDTLCSKDDILNLPVHPDPPGIASGHLQVDLLKHQSQALRWCIEKENPVLPTKETDSPVQFWQLRKVGNKSFYFNVATKTPQQNPPALGKGALVGDAMGLGKTLTMIALVVATKKEKTPGFSRATLIVAPVSILSNWEKQILDHCVRGKVSTYLYYGNNRSISAEELQRYDIVITTYQTIAGEHTQSEGSSAAGPSRKKKKVERTLFDVAWKRIILDEGHVIRNPKTKMARAVVELNADKRWVLTGTPIINSPRDLGSILTFLRICQPLDNEDFFKRLLLRPLKNGDPNGAELLRALMSNVCIRRTKEMQDSNGVPLIALPPVEMIKVPVTLTEEARRYYDEIEKISQSRFETMLSTSSSTIMQSNVLSMLTRLRQLALHPGLLPANYLEELKAAEENSKGDKPAIPVTPEQKLKLQDMLAQAIEDCEECPICFNVLDDARITSCAHMFCVGCIMEVITRDARCPMDRRELTAADLFERAPPPELTQAPRREETPEETLSGSSAKVDQLVQLLRLIPSDEKCLVFSQFTSFLDKIAEAFKEEGIPFVQFDGKMSARRRQEAIARFSVPIENSSGNAEKSSRGRQSSRKKDKSRRSLAEEDAGDSEDDYTPGDEDAAMDEQDSFDTSGTNPRVMLISLKAGALGLNLTVANNVFLMDPWWQEGIESQAIDRVNRIGQKKNVHVYQLIAENTVESKVLDIQERKKVLIKEAFSGIKSKETQRQQKEARLQDLIELFGLRRQPNQGEASTSTAA